MNELGHRNATAMMYSIELLSSSGAPDYFAASRAASAFAKEGLFPEDYRNFIGRIEAQFAQTQEKRLTWPRMSIMEDSIQRGIAIAGEKVLGPLPEIFAKPNWRKYFRARTEADDISGKVFLDGPCAGMLDQVRALQDSIILEDERQYRLIN